VKSVGKENKEGVDFSDDEQAHYDGGSYYEKEASSHKHKHRSASPMSEDMSGEALLEQSYERKKSNKEAKRARESDNYEDMLLYVQEQEAKLERKRKKYAEEAEEHALATTENEKGRAATKQDADNTDPPALNGDFLADRGALGLSQEKMALVREKKEEIERAYRQDCETFSAVVKMLISKNVELEELLKDSLKENLKDIGQRCIQELKEFIEGVKIHDL